MEKTYEFTLDGKKYKLRKPSSSEIRQSKAVYNSAFNEAIQSKCPLAAAATKILTEQGLWNEAKQKEFEGLRDKIAGIEFTLTKGGIRKSEARKLCIQLRELRFNLQELYAPVSDFNQHTAEGQGDNARFDYLASVCIINDDGTQVFNSYEDYLERNNTLLANVGARKFAEMYYGLSEDFQSVLIENQVLKQLKLVDADYRLINANGKLVDADNNLVNEFGERVDENGVLIDVHGHKLDKDGKFIVESLPFLDDDGKPIVEVEIAEAKAKVSEAQAEVVSG